MRSIGLLLLYIALHAGAMSMSQGEGTSRDIHPKAFVRNHGQWPATVRYGILGAGAKAALTADGIELFSLISTVRMPQESLLPGFENALRQTGERPAFSRTRLRFLRPSPRLNIVEGEETVTRMHFYMGREKAGWHENVGTVRSLTYENVWENIDLEYRYDGERLRQLIRVRPGGDPRDIAFIVDGADAPEAVLRPAGIQTLLERKMPMEIRVDTLRPRPGLELASWRQLVETEFCTFFGGNGNEHAWDIDVDGNSRMTLYLLTSSGDLPVKNEMKAMIDGSYDQYLARIDCDGNTLLSGTYFGSWNNELRYTTFPNWTWQLGLEHNEYRIHRAQSGDLLITTHADTRDFPVTPDAVQTTFADRVAIYGQGGIPSNDVVMRFSSTGVLMASTFLEGPTFAALIDIATGPDGDVYVLGHATGEQWFITPGVVHPFIQQKNIYPSPQGGVSTAYLVRLSPKLDAVRWGTYFFTNGINLSDFVHTGSNPVAGAGNMRHMDLEVDSEGCPVIVGTADSLRRLPITSSYGTVTAGKSFAWVVRLAADARSYRYATAFHSGDWSNAHALVLDGDNNALIVGSTGGQGFPALSPLLLPLPQPKPRRTFIAKLDPDGNILNSALMEFTSAVQVLNDIALTRCGEIVIDYERPSWLAMNAVATRDPFPPDGNAPVLFAAYIVCDSTLRSISFAAPGHPDSGTDSYDDRRGGWSSSWNDYLTFDDAGYFYELHGSIGTARLAPILYNTSRVTQTQTDLLFSRHHYPLCQLVNSEVTVVDTIVVSTPPDPLAPTEFPVVVTVSSVGAAADARQVEGDLFLPDGINTIAGDSVVHLVFESDRMHPNSRISRTVMVRATREFVSDTLSYVFVGHYSDTRRVGECIRPVIAGKAITILRRTGFDQQPPDCELFADSGRISFPAIPCVKGTVPVQLTLRHHGNMPWEIGDVVLRLPDGMGVSFYVRFDSLRGNATLRPGDSLSWTWMLNLSKRLVPVTAHVSAHVFEKDGRELTSCETQIPIPAGPGVVCAMTLPASVDWDTAENRALTDPVTVNVMLENQRDSSTGAVTMRIDLSRAPHLLLDVADTVVKQFESIRGCGSLQTAWTLHATEPARTISSDTVVVLYSFAGDSAQYFCESRLRINRLESAVSCTLILPDTLRPLLSDPRLMDTLRISAELHNTGTAAAQLREATLSIDGVASFTAPDSLRREPGVLAAGASTLLSWRVLVPASPYMRDLRCVVTVLDESGRVAATCPGRTWLAPVPASLSCATAMPDSVHFDRTSGSSIPDPIPVSVTVRNTGDTLLAGVSATIDLAAAPLLRLKAGQLPMQPLPPIPARDSATLTWLLETVSVPERNTPQDIAITISASVFAETWQCAASTVLEGIPLDAKLRCMVFGHDSAYYDPRYERIIPDPLQVWYSIVNDGNAPSQPCAVTLVLPEGWRLADGVANPADFGSIDPGDTLTRAWLITPEEGAPWRDRMTLTFTSDCGADSIDGGCDHNIGFSTALLRDIVFTPLRMYFRAEKNGVLPPAQSAEVWTFAADPLRWTATPQASWLDVQPAVTDGPGRIDIRPLTTALPSAVYSSAVELQSVQQQRRSIDVVYEVTDNTMEIPSAPVAPGSLRVYPNPFPTAGGGALYIALSEGMRETTDDLTFSVHDMLGRELQRGAIPRSTIVGEHARVSLALDATQRRFVLITIRGTREAASALLLLTP
ncbi:MAG: NEW3 domain-containing protein [Bacteroidota bacterium]|jgi:hypothetical protein|nr:NEW3 domain-containing protein [Bacteroidota bacterium]